jgi:aspartate/methionine/tyrosine aminotransferase
LQALASARALDYDPQSKGLREARQAVAGYYRDEHAVNYLDPEQIVLTTEHQRRVVVRFSSVVQSRRRIVGRSQATHCLSFWRVRDVKLMPYPLIYDHGWLMDFPSLQKAVTREREASWLSIE